MSSLIHTHGSTHLMSHELHSTRFAGAVMLGIGTQRSALSKNFDFSVAPVHSLRGEVRTIELLSRTNMRLQRSLEHRRRTQRTLQTIRFSKLFIRRAKLRSALTSPGACKHFASLRIVRFDIRCLVTVDHQGICHSP